MASGLLRQLTFGGMDLNTLCPVAILWTLLVMGVFAGPLLLFAPGLARLRERAVLEHGELVTHHNRLGEHRIREHFQASGEPDIDAISSMADIAPLIQTVYGIRLIPGAKWAVLPLIVAAGIPLLAVVVTQVPVSVIVQKLINALL